MLPRSYLLVIYKSFVRLHRDYGDTVYDQPNNSSLTDKIESLQYNAGEKKMFLSEYFLTQLQCISSGIQDKHWN